MEGMVEDAFQEFDEPSFHLPTLKGQLHYIVMDAFTIVDKMPNSGSVQSDDGFESLRDNGCSNPEEKKL